MGNRIVVGLAGICVIGTLAVGTMIAGVIMSGGILFASENRSFGELSLREQFITVGVIPAIVILVGLLPWWLGDFSLRQSLVLSVTVHTVSIGLGLATQQPVLLLIALIVGWIVLPVVLASDA